MNNFERHAKSDKLKWVLTAVAFVLVFALLASLLAAVITETNPKQWIEALQQQETPDEGSEGEVVEDEGGESQTEDGSGEAVNEGV